MEIASLLHREEVREGQTVSPRPTRGGQHAGNLLRREEAVLLLHVGDRHARAVRRDAKRVNAHVNFGLAQHSACWGGVVPRDKVLSKDSRLTRSKECDPAATWHPTRPKSRVPCLKGHRRATCDLKKRDGTLLDQVSIGDITPIRRHLCNANTAC